MTDFSVWNNLPDAQVQNFLASDYAHPSRAVMAAEVLRFIAGSTMPVLMAEVGPAIGRDFGHYYAAGVRAGRLHYTAYEGSWKLASAFKERHPDIPVINGGFAELPPLGFDIVVSRAVIEHQPTLEPALTQQLRAARRLCLIGWFIPPGDTLNVGLHPIENVHYNRYPQSEVAAAFEKTEMHLEVVSGTWIGSGETPEPYAVYIGRRQG